MGFNGDPFILWRAVDPDGYELEILLHFGRARTALPGRAQTRVPVP